LCTLTVSRNIKKNGKRLIRYIFQNLIEYYPFRNLIAACYQATGSEITVMSAHVSYIHNLVCKCLSLLTHVITHLIITIFCGRCVSITHALEKKMNEMYFDLILSFCKLFISLFLQQCVYLYLNL